MLQIHPDHLRIDDITGLLGADDRPPSAERPWVSANMVASADGAFAVDGRSGPLGGVADREMFHALRSIADVILVAAGTARAERYRRPQVDPALAEERIARGQASAPVLVLVSRSLALPEDLPLLSGEGPTPQVFHPAAADAALLPRGVTSRIAGEAELDLRDMLAQLRADGARHVLCEGGPNLLGQLHRAGLLDELFLTVAADLVGGRQVGLLGPGEPQVVAQRLHRVLYADDDLFLTYRRADLTEPSATETANRPD